MVHDLRPSRKLSCKIQCIIMHTSHRLKKQTPRSWAAYGYTVQAVICLNGQSNYICVLKIYSIIIIIILIAYGVMLVVSWCYSSIKGVSDVC